MQSYRQVYKATGLPLNSYFSASKIKWIFDNVKVRQEDIRVGTIDSWLVHELTEEKNHLIEASNASRTLLMDLKKVKWSEEMLELFGLQKSILPEIVPSTYNYGNMVMKDGTKVPITGIVGDQQAACIGHGLREHQAKITYGTGAFMLTPMEKLIIKPKIGLQSTVWYLRDKTYYALEGGVEVAGSGLGWLMNLLNSNYNELNNLPDSEGVCFVPAFSGLYAPHWDGKARGTILGLTHSTTKQQILKAYFEGIAQRSAEVLQAMTSQTKTQIKKLMVDGGMAKNTHFLQLQADIAGVDIQKPEMLEVTAKGAAIIAGLQTKLFDQIPSSKPHIELKNQKTEEWRDQKRQQWKKAISRAKNWADQQ